MLNNISCLSDKGIKCGFIQKVCSVLSWRSDEVEMCSAGAASDLHFSFKLVEHSLAIYSVCVAE